MSEAWVMSRVRKADNWIVAGQHWAWGCGYDRYSDAEQALHTAKQPAYAYTRCSQCGGFVAGLHEQPYVCAGCRKKETAAGEDLES